MCAYTPGLDQHSQVPSLQDTAQCQHGKRSKRRPSLHRNAAMASPGRSICGRPPARGPARLPAQRAAAVPHGRPAPSMARQDRAAYAKQRRGHRVPAANTMDSFSCGRDARHGMRWRSEQQGSKPCSVPSGLAVNLHSRPSCAADFQPAR